jgi:hypothetical protein
MYERAEEGLDELARDLTAEGVAAVAEAAADLG